jgi:antitoxin component HigA of HigAB toxin-antitoxin module
MERHAAVPGVQTHGCIALTSLSQFQKELRHEIGAKGGISQVLKAMTDHTAVCTVTECVPLILAMQVRRMLSASLAAISALTLDDEDNRALAAGLDAIPSVLAAMHKHQDSAVVQMHACTALANLMDKSPADKTSVTSLGGLEAVIESMVAHPAEADMQEAACAAIEEMVLGNRENQLLVSAEDGVHWIVTAMTSHKEAAGEHKCCSSCTCRYAVYGYVFSTTECASNRTFQQATEWEQHKLSSHACRCASSGLLRFVCDYDQLSCQQESCCSHRWAQGIGFDG